jgi:hypothetical protein
LKTGSVGVAAHFLATYKWPYYKKVYITGKALFVVSSFVVGWAIGGENAVQDFRKEQWRRRDASRFQAHALESARPAQPAPAASVAATSPAAAPSRWVLRAAQLHEAPHVTDLEEDARSV